jgi:hypothetical protein
MNMQEARNLSQGTILNVTRWDNPEVMITNADGTPARFKVTSVKTWKTRPNDIEVKIQRGLREFHVLTADDLSRVTVQ